MMVPKELVRRPTVKCGKSMAVKVAGQVTDINEIMAKARSGAIGVDIPTIGKEAIYGDFTGIDFEVMATQVAEARSAFMELPADIREHYGNDPGAVIRAINDSAENEGLKKTLIEQGILNAPEEPEPEVVQKVEIVNPEVPSEE